jgi:hypothetical protein
MDKNSANHLAEIIARVQDPERAKAGLQQDRDRLARIFREARIRVKANKAAHGGIYTA